MAPCQICPDKSKSYLQTNWTNPLQVLSFENKKKTRQESSMILKFEMGMHIALFIFKFLNFQN